MYYYIYYAEKQKEKEPAAIAFTSNSATRSSKKLKNKNNSNEIIQINDIESIQKWLEQEQQAVELLRQKVALKRELSELRQR